MFKTIKQNYKLYLFVLILAIGMFLPYIILNKGIILQPGDPFELNYKLWLGNYNQIRLGEFGQFNWSLGFGANTLSYVFYTLSSPFFLLTLLFPKEFIPYSFLVYAILQLWLAFIAAHVWLNKINKNNLASILGAFIVAFGAYGIFYLQAEQFIKCLFLYPLALYFTECFLTDKKYNGLVITIGVIGLTQFYLLYQLIPFICLYALFRYLLINQKNIKFKEVLLCGTKFVGWLLLGIAISAAILVPCAYLILSMPRFTTNTLGLFDHLSFRQVYEVFTSLFTPMFQKLDANAFIASNQYGFFGWSGTTPLYCLILTPCLLSLIFFIKEKFNRNMLLGFYGILGLFTFFQIFSYIFQASIDTRWYYMYLLLNAYAITYISSLAFDNYFTKKQLLISFSAPLVLIPCFLVISYCLKFNTGTMLLKLGISSLIMMLFIIGYAVLFIKKFNKKILIGLLSIEVLYCGVLFYYFNDPISYKRFESNPIENDISTYFHELDDGFYRVLYDRSTFTEWKDGEEHSLTLTTANEPVANAYPGVAFYESIYNTNQEAFLNRFKSTHNMPQNVGRTNIYNLLSTKYWYTFNNETPIPYGYEEIYKDDNYDYTVYQNPNFVELGFAYDKTINADYLVTLPYLEQDRIMQEYLATPTSNNTVYEIQDNIELITTLPSDTIRIYEFDEPVQNVTLYFEVFGIPNTKITTYYKDEVVNEYDIWQFNYIDIPVYQPIDKVMLDGEDIYGTGTQIPMYISNHDNQYSSNFKELTKNQFENVVFNNDYLSGDITITDSAKTVFTSIPFDKGWSVYVDGNKIDYEKVQLGFIGFELEPGTYHVEFKYEIPFLKVGITISLVSIGILVLANVLNKRKKSNAQ